MIIQTTITEQIFMQQPYYTKLNYLFKYSVTEKFLLTEMVQLKVQNSSHNACEHFLAEVQLHKEIQR